jgi:acetylglutamate kinase
MLIVVKYGGNAMGAISGDPLLGDLAAAVADGARVVLVHGGGPHIDEALAGTPQRRVAGLRVTDEHALAVIERVLCGGVNKALVRALAALGVRAVGVSGQDGALLVADPAVPIGGESLGFVGERPRVDPRLLEALLDAGFTPVVAPLAVSRDGTTALNVNADTAAGAIAGALAADAYVNATNVDQVLLRLDDPASALSRISANDARTNVARGAFAGGMQPKIESALDALERGARSAIICGSGAGVLRGALTGAAGTIIAS